MPKPKNLLIVGVLMILSGMVGVWVGEQRLKIAFANWKPAVVVNKSPTVFKDQEEVDFSLFWTVWDKLNQNYVDKTAIDPKKLVDGAISGMVSSLGDPYTAYLPVVQNKESKEELGGAFEGVGIQLGFKDNRLAVVSPLDGTPAFRSGVKAGDLILHIKDEKKGVDRDTDGMTLPEAVQLIRGTGGTQVRLTLARQGTEKPFEVDLTRETIVVKSVTVEMKEINGKKVAWLKLTRFGDRTQEEWNTSVSEIAAALTAGEIAGVVLDVRNNPGGYLEGAVYTASEFLPTNRVVVTQQYGDGTKTENRVSRNGRLLKAPLAVLVNAGSASAAEILAGALQDHDRATIVGEKSFGKGSVQQPEDFADGSGVHITVAKWLLPSGRWIDKNGIVPDIEVTDDSSDNDDTRDTQLEKAIEVL